MALTETGYQYPTLTEVIDRIAERQRHVFPDINLDPSTPDGQLNGLFAEAVHVCYEVAAGIYNGMDPRAAAGIMLDRVCAIAGVVRKDASPVIVMCRFSGSPGAYVPVRTIVSDNLVPQNQYITRSNHYLDSSGEAVIACYCTETGKKTVPAGAVDNIVTPVAGVDSVTNDTETTGGNHRETDSELRVRRQRSLALGSTALLDSITSGLLAEYGVVAAKVYENSEAATDPDGIPGHSIYCVVQGGLDDRIGNVIMENKSVGAGTHGTTSVDWHDITGKSYEVRFSRPTPVSILLNVKISGASLDPGIITDVRNKIMAHIEGIQDGTSSCTASKLGIGDDVFASIFYSAFSGAEEYEIVEILVGTTAPASDPVASIGIDEISDFAPGDINVEV